MRNSKNKQKPPRIAEYLLKKVFQEDFFKSAGDFREIYNHIVKKRGRFGAWLWYWFQVLISLKSFITGILYWNTVMIKSYIKIAFRNIGKQKIYSLINISGLAIGLACFIMIILFAQYELTFDDYHKNGDRIFRVIKLTMSGDAADIHSGTPAPLAQALRDEFPEVENTVRINGYGEIIVKYKNRIFLEDNVYLADATLFEVFSYPLLVGNPENIFKNLHSVVITESMAKKYFGDENPIGKSVNFNKRIDLIVTGIAKDVPENSHFKFDFIAPFELIGEVSWRGYLTSWGAFNFNTYVLLRKNSSAEELGKKTIALMKKYRGENEKDYQVLFFQPLRKIHLDGSVRGNFRPVKDIKYIYFFIVIAVIILSLACINYMNLSVAQYSGRAREVGMRKVIGAYRFQLVKQFLGESILTSFIALPLGIGILALIIPHFNRLTFTRLDLNMFLSMQFLTGLLVIALFVGMISGSYPAFFSAGLKPVKALWGDLKSSKKGRYFRNLLLIFQFSVSVILIISTLVVTKQMRFIRNKDIGINKDHVINITLFSGESRRNVKILKEELLKNPNILNASASTFSPLGGGGNNSANWEGKTDDNDVYVRWYFADYDFLDTYQIDLVEGRYFSEEFTSDRKSAYILNESAMRLFGWDSGVGKRFDIQSAAMGEGTVIGVIKDFNFKSLHHRIGPMTITLTTTASTFSVRLNQENIPQTISYIKEVWKKIVPDEPLDYSFLDEDYDRMYSTENNIKRMFNYSTFLAVFIASMGLLGIASFSISIRTKEIGIRKVLGASLSNIIRLLSKEFVKLVVVANIVAWPLAYYFMKNWLQSFEYRISMTAWIFLIATSLVLIISFITISYHSVKAACANPVNSLKYE